IMAPPITPEIRQRILSWHHNDGMSAREIASLAACSERTVYYILSFDRDYGTDVNPFARKTGRTRSLDTGDMNYIFSLISARPKIYLDELQEELFNSRGVE
ncbi:hypothetical protein HYPSUDRAFT_125385, partial [Hypholoma sublateritium FD-334 SS-4]